MRIRAVLVGIVVGGGAVLAIQVAGAGGQSDQRRSVDEGRPGSSQPPQGRNYSLKPCGERFDHF